jgi:hypothetical protein
MSFRVDNPWFSGSADIPTFSTEEILSTKIRALLQRNKGRDLIDIAHALDIFPKLDVQRTVDMFGEYVKQKPIPRWEAEKRMFEKLERRGFLADVQPLLAADERARFDDAAGIRCDNTESDRLRRRRGSLPSAATPTKRTPGVGR